ncbi:hypothetical protein WSM22_07120 [Cytophagales bacterium WSM2-2]|nr:hypothetical protein WSM22_07120 [Cytophagales bacterium WSM2-2]
MKRSTLFRPLAFTCIVLVTGSCAITNSKSVSVDVDKISQDGFVMAKPIVAEVKVEIRKIQGTATVKNSDYAGAPAQAEVDAKSLAIMDAVKKGDADVIVQPMYSMERDMKNTTVTVTGFAGKYKAFRPYTEADRMAFNLRVKMDRTSLVTVIDQPTEVGVTKGTRKIK